MLVLGEYDFNLVSSILSNVSHRILSFVARIDKFYIESLCEVCGQKLDVDLCECFSKADSSPTGKRTVGVSVPLFTRWSFAERVVIIPSIWKEFKWPLPLLSVEMKGIESDIECISWPKFDTTDCSFLEDMHVGWSDSRILESQSFTHDMIEII